VTAGRLARLLCLAGLGAAGLLACDRETPLDTVVDTAVDPAVWHADAQKIAAVLPPRVGTFVPSEGADPFTTSYGSGPVFGASCAYADGARQLTVRVESGNIRSRATTALAPRAGATSDTKSVTRAATVHGRPATQRWDAIGRLGEVTFLVARRYLVHLRLVPAASDAEALALAESIDLGPLEALALDGVTR